MCTLLSIVVPMLIAGSLSLRELSVKNIIVNIFTSPIQPILLHYQLVASKLIRKQMLKQNDMSLALNFKDLSTKISVLEEDLVKQHRVQLGTETVFQLLGNVIILCYAYSNTKSTQGLAALFEHDSVDILITTISSKVLLSILLTINMLSYIWVHYKGIVQEYAKIYRLIGKLLLLLCIACSSIVRIMSMTLYFSPSLGLFNLLHHYQGIIQQCESIELCI